MKIQPLKQYPRPAYPSMREIQAEPELLARIPRRWENASAFTALLGIGLYARTLMAAENPAPASSVAAAAAVAPEKPAKGAKSGDAASQVRRATTLVAPMLAEAMEYDGRGAFGCVIVNPPTFLSEDEALELIRAELESAGLKLDEDVELPDVELPGEDSLEFSNMEEDTDEETGAHTRSGDSARHPKLVPTNYPFNLADKKRSIYVEYLSGNKYYNFMSRGCSSVHDYNFPKAARKLAGYLEKYDAATGVVFGVFFDPLADADVQAPDDAGLDADQRRMAEAEYSKAMGDAMRNVPVKAKDKLRKQVRSFVSYLRQQGLLENSR